MTDQELADAIRNSPHFAAGWFDDPARNSLGKPVSLQTADEIIAGAVRNLLRDNPPWVPAEGEKVEWQGHLWTVEHVHDGHAYLFATSTGSSRHRAPLSELTRP